MGQIFSVRSLIILSKHNLFSHSYPILHYTSNQLNCTREAEKREQIFTTALEMTTAGGRLPDLTDKLFHLLLQILHS